eukprot:4479955-Amphidinium_carterae.2
MPSHSRCRQGGGEDSKGASQARSPTYGWTAWDGELPVRPDFQGWSSAPRGQFRPAHAATTNIAPLPQIYRFWSAACRSDVLTWRQQCKDRGETPLGLCVTPLQGCC